MKSLVVVVTFVVVSFVFAAHIVRETGGPQSLAPRRGLQEGSEITKGQIAVDTQEETEPQTYNEHTANRPFLGAQQDTRPSQSPGQQPEENDWWRWLAGGAYLTGI